LDEIGNYLEQDSKDFHASLDMQYELLLQKQQHIEHVVATIERVKAIVKDNDTLDPGLIMMTIGINELLVMSKQGLPPEHHLVQECMRTMKLIVDQLLGQPLLELGTSEVGRVLKVLNKNNRGDF
jgi:uncharacterized protein related to proFAR isomerase